MYWCWHIEYCSLSSTECSCDTPTRACTCPYREWACYSSNNPNTLTMRQGEMEESTLRQDSHETSFFVSPSFALHTAQQGRLGYGSISNSQFFMVEKGVS